MNGLVQDVDVVVVGSGAAGLAAALTAHANGLKPLVIERSEILGGSSALAGGGILLAWAAGRVLVSAISTGPFPIELDLTPNWHILAFTGAVAITTGIVPISSPRPCRSPTAASASRTVAPSGSSIVTESLPARSRNIAKSRTSTSISTNARPGARGAATGM